MKSIPFWMMMKSMSFWMMFILIYARARAGRPRVPTLRFLATLATLGCDRTAAFAQRVGAARRIEAPAKRAGAVLTSGQSAETRGRCLAQGNFPRLGRI